MLFDSSLRRDLSRTFGATLVVILTIVLTMMLIRTLGQAALGRISPQDVVLLLGFYALGHLPTMLSLSLFISVVATLSRMYRDSEMVIWFASGRGLSAFLGPLFRFAWPILLVVAALALVAAERLARASDIAVALSIDALRGSVQPFEARIHEPRPYAGQRISAANVRVLLEGSAINKSHEHCGRVQDAYSLRCAAQVHGAARDALGFVAQTLAVEANAATDNPMVFAADDAIVSGGNFHGAPVAIAADLLAIAAVQFATISERRADRLVNPVLSELPAFLTPNSGLHSGYMMAQVTAAALASELKTLAHPASADTIPTSANREDHVSMSMGAALKAARALDLATRVVAVEILCACQAIDLLAPLKTSDRCQRAHKAIRTVAPHVSADRYFAKEMEAAAALVKGGALKIALA